MGFPNRSLRTAVALRETNLTEPVPLFIQSHTFLDRRQDGMSGWTIPHTAYRTQQDGVFLELEQVPDAQRDCLMALYDNLDGENWKKRRKLGNRHRY